LQQQHQQRSEAIPSNLATERTGAFDRQTATEAMHKADVVDLADV
jgi:hypothetical protein